MVSIRKAKPSDLNFLNQIFFLNIPKYFHEKEFEDFKKYFNSNHIETYFIIESEDKILGAAGYAYENKQTANICWVFVDPGFHSNGLGTKLVNHCIDILKKDNQLNVIQLETSNITYKFYEKMNFKLQYIKKEYWPNNDDLYFMNMNLI
ncbi:MAG: GNAT family N-acetyltransferase [Candidatus Marisimplicoccus sp.]